MFRSMRILRAAAAILLTGFTSGRVQGAMLAVNNPGFESVQIGAGYTNNAAHFPGWTRVGTPGAFTGVAHPPAGDTTLSGQVIGGFGSPTEGEQFGWTVNGFGFEQTISTPFDASENYLLSVDAALSADSDPTNANVGYTITFHLVGGYQLASQLQFSSAADGIKDGVFRTRTMSYVGGTLSDANDGIQMVIRVQSANFGGYATRYGAAFDNIRLETTPVPEPGATAFAATAFGFLLRRVR